jgi:hypothetical protein
LICTLKSATCRHIRDRKLNKRMERRVGNTFDHNKISQNIDITVRTGRHDKVEQ